MNSVCPFRHSFCVFILVFAATACSNSPENEDSAQIEVSEGMPVAPAVPVFEANGECAEQENPGACFTEQFWRVFQRDFDDRRQVHDSLGTWLEALTEEGSAEIAELYFARAQLGMALVLENSDLAVLTTIVPDLETAIQYNPSDPFIQIWLDTMSIATAEIQGDEGRVNVLLTEAFAHVEQATEYSTQSTLIASLTGTTIGLSKDSGAPEQTIALIERFDCHPAQAETRAARTCGRGPHRRSCDDWCSSSSEIAPFSAPGMLYHIGEAYARMGRIQSASEMMQLALQAPTADSWPFRDWAITALSDMAAFSASVNAENDQDSVFLDVYTNSSRACVFCHASPEARF